jgi:hypothetical protein
MKKAMHMYPLVEEYLSSGLSQQRFCEGKAIACSTFYYWLKKYKTATSAGFLEVDTQPVAASQQLELTYPNGVKLSIPLPSARSKK